jgi:hypothetical protein
MNQQPRIKHLDMTILDVMAVLSDGNPGAIAAMTELVTSAEKIDPDSVLVALGPLMMLDSFGIYGSRIWMLFEDLCGRDVAKTIGLLRAVQLGLCSEHSLSLAIDGDKSAVDLPALLASVRGRLHEFAAA